MKSFVTFLCCRFMARFRFLMVLAVIVLTMFPLAVSGERQRSLTPTEQRLVHRAQQAVSKKQYGEAQQMLAAYLEKHPEGVHYLVVFTLGNALAMCGNASAALGHYKDAATLNPDDPAVWQNMGKVYYDLQQYAEAGRCLMRAHELEKPPSPSMAYQAALAYILAEKPETARPLLEALVAREGGSPEPEWIDALLKVYLDLGLDDKALGLTRDLLGKAGDRPRLWQILAHIHMKRKAYRKAAAALEIYAVLTPMDAEKTRLLGDLYLMAGVPLKAAQTFESLLSNKSKTSLYEKTASAYIAAFRKNEAVAVLQQGIKRKATSKMWWALASVRYEEGLFDKAYKAYEQCTRHDTKNAAAYLMMGHSALQSNRLQDAETAFSKAVRYPRQRTEAEKMLMEIKRIQNALKKEVVKETIQ